MDFWTPSAFPEPHCSLRGMSLSSLFQEKHPHITDLRVGSNEGSDFLFPYNPHPPPPHPDNPPLPSHPRGLDFGPFRLCLAPFGSVWRGSVSGPFWGCWVGLVRGASVREKNITKLGDYQRASLWSCAFFWGESKGCLIEGCLNSAKIPKVGILKAGIPTVGIPKTGIPRAREFEGREDPH